MNQLKIIKLRKVNISYLIDSCCHFYFFIFISSLVLSFFILFSLLDFFSLYLFSSSFSLVFSLPLFLFLVFVSLTISLLVSLVFSLPSFLLLVFESLSLSLSLSLANFNYLSTYLGKVIMLGTLVYP